MEKPNCLICKDTGKVFVTVSDEEENGYEPCPHCDAIPCDMCGKVVVGGSEDAIPYYVAENKCSTVCYDCAHDGNGVFLCTRCGEWNISDGSLACNNCDRCTEGAECVTCLDKGYLYGADSSEDETLFIIGKCPDCDVCSSQEVAYEKGKELLEVMEFKTIPMGEGHSYCTKCEGIVSPSECCGCRADERREKEARSK